MSRKTLPPGLLSAEGIRAYEATSQESDLACALILANYIDQCLGSLLQASLIESSISQDLLTSPTGPLATFEARARMAYALALISKEQFQNLTRIAQIRNLFAHSHFAVKFEEPSIEPLCHELVLPQVNYQVVPGPQPEDPQEAFRSRFLTTPRMKYVFNSIFLANSLALKAMSASRRPDVAEP